MKALNTQEDEFTLPMTPLLDVVFLLLVFFLVSTSFVKPEKSIDIKLPTAEQAARPAPEQQTLIVNVRETGVMVVEGRVLTGYDDLIRTLRRAQKSNPGGGIVIRGDRRVFHNDVVRVMNATLEVGIEDMHIAVFDTEDE